MILNPEISSSNSIGVDWAAKLSEGVLNFKNMTNFNLNLT